MIVERCFYRTKIINKHLFMFNKTLPSYADNRYCNQQPLHFVHVLVDKSVLQGEETSSWVRVPGSMVD